jgi:hypothetical protein
MIAPDLVEQAALMRQEFSLEGILARLEPLIHRILMAQCGLSTGETMFSAGEIGRFKLVRQRHGPRYFGILSRLYIKFDRVPADTPHAVLAKAVDDVLTELGLLTINDRPTEIRTISGLGGVVAFYASDVLLKDQDWPYLAMGLRLGAGRMVDDAE